MRLSRTLTVLMLSVVVLGTGGVVIRAVSLSYQSRQLSEKVEREFDIHLTQAVPAAEAQRHRFTEAAGARPDREELDQECWFSTDDAGLTVENYRQACILDYTLTWSAPNRTQARALASRVAAASGESLEHATSDCTLLQGFDLTIVVTDRTCGYPPTLGLRPVEPARGNRVKGLRVEVRTSASLGEYDLGCKKMTLFCDNPLRELAFGTVTRP